MVEQLAEAKVKFAVVFASGFAETGAEGAAAQERLAAAVARSGIRLLGPNTNLNAFERFRDDLDGPAIALITQSGHQGRPVFSLQELGIRLSHWAPTGNEADLETADFISYFAERPEVGAIACYVEGLKDGRSFLLAADRAARRRVPVVAVKVGRTETGARTAASHTGKLTGADTVVDAAMRQFGVIRVDGLDELQDTATLLARARPPRAEGVVVYSISGGTGAHFADLATEAGLGLPVLSASKQAELHQWIPEYLGVANPVDNGGHPVGDHRGRKIIDAILDDPAVGVLICPITGPFLPSATGSSRTWWTPRNGRTSWSASSGAPRSAPNRPTARSCSAPPGWPPSARSRTASPPSAPTSTTTASSAATVPPSTRPRAPPRPPSARRRP